MADRLPLAQLPNGSTFRLTGRKTATHPDGAVSTEFIRPNGQVVGNLEIAADGSFTGGLVIPLAQAQVEALAIAMALGDIMRNLSTAETVIVRAVGIGPDQALWSPSVNQRPAYPPSGWVKVGHVDPDSL
jgi:hypothetical protein